MIVKVPINPALTAFESKYYLEADNEPKGNVRRITVTGDGANVNDSGTAIDNTDQDREEVTEDPPEEETQDTPDTGDTGGAVDTDHEDVEEDDEEEDVDNTGTEDTNTGNDTTTENDNNQDQTQTQDQNTDNQNQDQNTDQGGGQVDTDNEDVDEGDDDTGDDNGDNDNNGEESQVDTDNEDVDDNEGDEGNQDNNNQQNNNGNGNGTTQVSDENVRKRALFHRFKNLHDTIGKYIEKLNLLMAYSTSMVPIYREVCDDLSDLRTYVYDYMVIRFAEAKYTELHFFYQRALTSIELLFERLSKAEIPIDGEGSDRNEDSTKKHSE